MIHSLCHHIVPLWEVQCVLSSPKKNPGGVASTQPRAERPKGATPWVAQTHGLVAPKGQKHS